ncbi:MAG: U32 family peptidase [Dissulfurimicrobium sp.]|uniref:U32 family peptidase n=1 Tax=Dissulfurimicrobium sp. TaxID=2022436 RepID=UPI0040495E54
MLAYIFPIFVFTQDAYGHSQLLSYSGLCLFSSYFDGKSELKGRFVQPYCRRYYEWGEKTGVYFSMRDLSGLNAVNELRRIGVRSLKIEGRLRSPH